MAVRRSILILAAAVVLSAGGAAAFLFGRSAASYDTAFDVSVAAPAYAERGPIVLFDEGHRNAHLTTTGYRPLADLMRHDGYEVRASEGQIDAATLAPIAILVINGPRGANEANDGPAFLDAEQHAIVEWVRGGGSLLLITDHWPFGSSVADLSRRFGVEISGGMTADPEHHEPSLGDTHIVFSRQNGLLGDHPITSGRNAGERVSQVLTFTGQSLSVPEGAVAFMRLADTAVDYPPTTPQIVRDGADVRVSMSYGDAVPAPGRAQGVAFHFGQGRVVMLGETGMLRAQRDGRDRVGMNYPGYDNRQLALNIMHWLSRLT
jgi:hypothetical protein